MSALLFYASYALLQVACSSGLRPPERQLVCGHKIITLEFEASLRAPESYDALYITGIPNMEVVIKGGTQGDIATAAIVVHAARRVIEAPPGLLTMKDLPIIVCTS